jgi:phosphoesterase RecJ-like protein
MGKRTSLACADPVPSELAFIPGSSLVRPEIAGPFDLAIFVDCSEHARCWRGPAPPEVHAVPLINIDHHVTNVGYGTASLVDANASSTAEVVLLLIEHLGIAMDADTAMCLLTGIVTDTRGFRTNAVTIQTMDAAVRLMRAGADLATITREALDRRSIGALRLWGAAMGTIQIEKRVIWTAIPLAMSRQAAFTGGGDAGLASYLVGAEGTDGAVVFVEQEENRIDVGFRASPEFDVSGIALRLGGGGHALAAGCTQYGALDDVVRRVVSDLQSELARQRENSVRRDSQPKQASRPDFA